MSNQITSSEMNGMTDDNNMPTKNRKFKIVWLIGMLLLFLVFIYFSVAYYFHSHFLYGTRIDHVSCGMLSSIEAKEVIANHIGQYSITIIGRENIQDTVDASEIDLHIQFDQSFENILKNQNCYLWPLSFFREQDVWAPKMVTFDEDKLQDKVNSLVFFDSLHQKPPIDAHIGEYNSALGCYEIQKEYEGTLVDKQLLRSRLEKALFNLEDTLDLEQELCYKRPNRCSDHKKMNRLLSRLNQYVSSTVIYNWNGAEVVLNGDTISQWLSVQNDAIVWDMELLEEWVKNQTALHDTYRNEREFTTFTGEVINLRSSTFGWKTNAKAEIDALKRLVRKGQTIEREPLYTYKGYTKGQDDIGNSYVEINLSAQHLYLWIDGEAILETDFVSGNMSNGNGTPPGIFGVTYKQKDAILRGANYTTPVKYWMPFNGNIGMHDATWRKSFGGDIFLENGSHGCINLPLSMAEKIYEYMEKGFPVICYY